MTDLPLKGISNWLAKIKGILFFKMWIMGLVFAPKSIFSIIGRSTPGLEMTNKTGHTEQRLPNISCHDYILAACRKCGLFYYVRENILLNTNILEKIVIGNAVRNLIRM